MNKKEAAELLGVSTRLVERYASQGRLKVTYVRGKTGRVAEFEESDLEQFKAELEQTHHRATIATNNHDSELVGSLIPVEKRERLIDALEVILDRHSLPPAKVPSLSIGDKLLLNLEEAQALTGLSRRILRMAIEADKLRAQIIGRSWRVKRADLESYVQAL